MNVVRSFSAAVIAATVVAGLAPALSVAQEPKGFTVATGLNGPRGLRFGPDGALYIAEAGTAGTNSSGSGCKQVVPPVGPYTGGNTGRISKVSHGKLTTVASGFPSTVNAMGAFIGVADVVFMDDGTLYALVAGGGCSHGNPSMPAGIAQVDYNTGKWSLIANLSAFFKTNQTKYESADDFEPDGTSYSLIAVDGVLIGVEPNHGQVFSVTRKGVIKEVIDISASEGHIVPTAIAEREGDFYVGNLNLFPIDPQWARILTISKLPSTENVPPGFDRNRFGYHIVESTAGFTTVVAVDFGPDGLLYALELSDAPGNPTPGAGKVVRLTGSGVIEDVVTGLVVPTGMTFGPDGRLYVSNFGATGPGAGQILRFDIPR
jgi:hypothetical protein